MVTMARPSFSTLPTWKGSRMPRATRCANSPERCWSRSRRASNMHAGPDLVSEAVAAPVAPGTPLVAHVIFRLDVGGLENGVVNLLNRMPRDRYRHAIVCLAGYSD